MRAACSLAITLFLLPALLLVCLAREARAEPTPGRAALLIANAAYPDSDAVLPTPVADAQALGEALKRKGFSVEIAENLTKEGMQAAIDRLARRVERGATALVFFGGYGIQVARRNYLVPVDARIWSEADVLRDGIAVEGLMADLEKRGARTRLLVLDASRRNPFERRFRSFSTGLAPAKTATGSLTLYSAAAGSVVNEGNATRSLFVTELVKQIGLADLTAEQAFGGVRDALAKATRNQQNPALASGLEEAFAFDPNRPKQAVAPKPVPAAIVMTPPAIEAKPLPPVANLKPPVVEPALPPEQPKLPELEPEILPPPKEVVPPPKVIEAKPPIADPLPPMSGKAGPIPSESPVEPEATQKAPPLVVANKGAESPLAAEEEAVRDFNAANGAGSKQAYKDFLARHPAGSLAARARAEIARIEATEQMQPSAAEPRPYSDAERKRKAALDQRIAKNPREALAYYERGQLHAQRGDAAFAIADFDQAIRIDPTQAEAFNNRCWMRAVAGDLQRALADCNQALKLRQGFVDALDSRGFVNLKLGEYRAALTDYDAALKADASHGSALYGRGVAKRRLGQIASGDRDLASALELNPAIDKEFSQYGLR